MNTSPRRDYTQDHVDTAHWLYRRYYQITHMDHEELVNKVAQDMNFTSERLKEMLSKPEREVVEE